MAAMLEQSGKTSFNRGRSMTIFSRPAFATLLVVLFVLAGVAGGPADGLEVTLMHRLAAVRADWPQVTQAVTALTTLGGAPVTLAVAGGASLWLLLRPAPERALLLAVTVLAERLLAEGLKDWIGRARPPLDPRLLPHSLAFPSGHAANSMTAFLATALIVAPPAYRRAAAVVALTMATAVGLSRVYLGVHWPSDVIGGWALGLLAVTVALTVGQRSGAMSLEAQHDIVRRHGAAAGENEPA
jgi:membrane-associated phospholipid phosphatase